MEALIGMTNKVSSNLSNAKSYDELKTLLKDKIEDSIMNDKSIIVNVSTPLMECRNTILADDYEFHDDSLYINCRNYEIHICLDKAHIKYDDTLDENFMLSYDNTNVLLYFIE